MSFSNTNEPLDDIQLKMQAVRDSLDYDVEEFRDSTRQLSDWKTYVRNYPWVSIGAAVAVGYIIVPAKKEIVSPDASELIKLAKKNKLVVQANPEPQKKSGLAGAIFGLASSMLVRGLATYAGGQLGKLTGQTADDTATHSAPNTVHHEYQQ